MALNIWRRHGPRCKHSSRNSRRCSCPFWVEGTTEDGRIIKRRSLRTRIPAEARRRADRIEKGSTVFTKLLKDLTDEIQADVERRQLSSNLQQKFRRLFKRINEFAEKNGLERIDAWTASEARQFAGTLQHLAPSTVRTDIERLRGAWRFAIESEWVSRNPWMAVKPPKETQRPTMPFTREEMEMIYAACDPMELALVAVMRYSGLRIGDACRLEKSRLKGNRLFLYTAKTGTPVYAILPAKVLEILESFPHASRTHYFWDGNSTRDSIRNIWCDQLSEMFDRSGVEFDPDELMKSHRLRDTFAVEALLAGVPIEEVSRMLGHASIKTTEKHYGPWVSALQEKMEKRFEQMWANDPMPEVPYNSRTTVN